MFFRLAWAAQTIFSKGVLTILINKIIAVNFGVLGLATFGYWQNFLTILNGLSNGSSQNGIILLSSRALNDNDRFETLKAAVVFSTVFAIFSAIGLLLLLIFDLVPSSVESTKIILPLVFLTPAISLTVVLSSYAAGLRKHLIVGGGQLIASISLLFGVYISQWHGGIVFAVNAVSLSLIPQLIFLAYFFRSFIEPSFLSRPTKVVYQVLRKHSFTTIFMLASFPLAHYLIRGFLLSSSLDQSLPGIWEAGLKLGGIISALMSFLNSTYFLPSLKPGSKESNWRLYWKFKSILMIPLLGIFLISLIPGFNLVELLFSSDFGELESVIALVLLTEFVRGSHFFTTNMMIATGKLKGLLTGEIVLSILLSVGVYSGAIPLKANILFLWLSFIYFCGAIFNFISLRVHNEL